ncbi:MAG: metallopeptidase family protein [Minisyncoccia bacterium]
MLKEDFEKLVIEVTKNLPSKFLEKLKNVAIVVQEEPDKYQLKQGGYLRNAFLLGLYEGVPQNKRGYYNRALPDKISLFQKNIEKISGGEIENIKKVIRNTLWHEIGHHLGFTEEELQKLKPKS